MTIRYSKNAISLLASLHERDVASITGHIKGIIAEPPTVKIQPVPGKSSSIKTIVSGSWHVIFRYEDFKGVAGIYVMEIFDDEDYYYFRR